MKKFWPFIPLILWILLFPLIGGLIYWKTNYSSFLYLSFISIISIFNFVWYILKLSYKRYQMDLATTIGNWLILNAPAYFLIKNCFQALVNQEIKKDRTELFNFEYTDWELEELKTKNLKKYNQLMNKEKLNKEVKHIITIQEQIIHGFSVYLLIKIYNKKPDLTNTYELIQIFHENVEDEKLYQKNIAFFKETDLTFFFNSETLEQLNPDIIDEVLVHLDPEEINNQFKQERPDLQLEAKAILEKL